MNFLSLLRYEPRPLSFGLLHTFAATIGQTFVIALFLPGVKQSFALGDAEISLVFTGTTLASAVVLWKVGAWLDRTDVVRYSLACGALLAVSCVLMAISVDLTVFVMGMFCLRLAGNGLLTHVALTATARYFTRGRGQALSLVLLGSSVGEAGLPAPLVALIGAVGWRWSMVAVGCLGLLLVIAAAAAVLKDARFRAPEALSPDLPAAPVRPRPKAASDGASRTYFVLSGPLFVAMPLTVTSAVFHQALIAGAIGVSLQWFAVSFMAFALSRVLTSLAIGPMIDRRGSAALFCTHLLPLAAGTVALITLKDPVMVPLYWFCAGVTSGLGTVLQMTVLAERVEAGRLAGARSIMGAATIVASALGPTLYGLALAAGAAITAILWSSVAALLTATAAGYFALRSDPARRA